jgi:hypothetical protein
MSGPRLTTDSGAIPNDDVLARPARREMLPVSFRQWDRIKARVTTLGNPRIDYLNYVVGAWGICIPCALSFVAYLPQTDTRPTWALPAYGSVALASGAVALLLRRFQKDEDDLRVEDAADIVSEMTTYEESYLRGEAASR